MYEADLCTAFKVLICAGAYALPLDQIHQGYHHVILIGNSGQFGVSGLREQAGWRPACVYIGDSNCDCSR